MSDNHKHGDCHDCCGGHEHEPAKEKLVLTASVTASEQTTLAVAGKHGVGCGLLVGAKLAVKRHVNRLTSESLVVEFHGNLVRFE